LLYPEYHDNNDFLESEDVNKAKGVEKLSMYSSGPEELRKRALTDSDYANYNTPQKSGSECFNLNTFESLGKSFAISLLDIID